MITEVSIRCQKTPEVGIRRIPAYTPQYTTALNHKEMYSYVKIDIVVIFCFIVMLFIFVSFSGTNTQGEMTSHNL